MERLTLRETCGLWSEEGGVTDVEDRNPRVTYEVGTRIVRATARVTSGDERERIWSKQKCDRPYFGEYERKTTREIPVIVLEPEPESTSYD